MCKETRERCAKEDSVEESVGHKQWTLVETFFFCCHQFCPATLIEQLFHLLQRRLIRLKASVMNSMTSSAKMSQRTTVSRGTYTSRKCTLTPARLCV